MDGRGVRCVSTGEWVTAAETAECVLALDALGRDDEAVQLFTWVQALRNEDGSYWTGMVYPEEATYPPLERSTYTAGAMVLAADALGRCTPASGLFRGEGLPSHLDLTEPAPEAPVEPALRSPGRPRRRLSRRTVGRSPSGARAVSHVPAAQQPLIPRRRSGILPPTSQPPFVPWWIEGGGRRHPTPVVRSTCCCTW